MKVHSTNDTLLSIQNRLASGRPFCFTRYGDSQIMGMDGWKGHAHEQVMNHKLRTLLIKAFQVNDPDYMLAPACGFEEEPGMVSGTFARYKNDAEMVKTVERVNPNGEFWNCEALHYGMLFNQEPVRAIFQEIAKRDVLIVAGDQLDVRKIAFKNADFIGIPMDNAFKHWEAIYGRIMEYQPEIILLSCGLTGQVLQYFQFLDRPHITTINMGSVFNALLGITEGPHTRAWIRHNADALAAFAQSL